MDVRQALVEGANRLLCASSTLVEHSVKILKPVARKTPALLVWPVWQSIPVGGLDALSGQSVLYSLRRSLPEGPETVEAWLQALQLAQLASDRLLQSLRHAQRNLKFWRSRLKAGSHGSFMLLERGPVGFVTDVLDRLKLRGAEEGSGVAASDRIEERIIALELLSTQLAESLAAVHQAAAVLQLGSIDMTSSGQVQQKAVKQAVHAAVFQCLSAISDALNELTPQVEQLQQHNTAARQLHLSGVHQASHSSTIQPAAHPSKPGSSTAAVLTVQQLQQQLSDVQQQLGVSETDLVATRRLGDAGSAVAAASLLATQLGGFVAVPHWALMPSTLQRHWIRYSIYAGLGLSAGTYLYKHSRLAGSTDLDYWAKAAATAVKGAWADHVVSPLLTVRNELFSTFRSRPSIVSTGEFEADKESLLRMLAEFQRDHPAAAEAAAAINSSSSGSSAGSIPGISSSSRSDVMTVKKLLDTDAVNQGMQVVMRCYENDLKNPVRNLITGELARTLLIQVQRLKLDTEAAMLELDQILRANELSISLVAAVPALLITWTLLRGLWVLLLVRQPPDPRREALPCRLAMAELERSLSALASLQEATAQQQPQPLKHAAATVQAVGQGLPESSNSSLAAEGMVLYKLFRVYSEAQRLYRLKDSSSKYSEWPHLQADLMELVRPCVAAASKLDLHARMLRTYSLLQP